MSQQHNSWYVQFSCVYQLARDKANSPGDNFPPDPGTKAGGEREGGTQSLTQSLLVVYYYYLLVLVISMSIVAAASPVSSRLNDCY